jgi:hypothetical protein
MPVHPTVLLVALLAVVACSSDDGGGGGGAVDRDPPPEGACYQDPLACEDGTTCAFDDEHGESMSCLPAGDAAEGEACQNVAGEPVCDERLACIQLAGDETGTCARFCDGGDDCGGGLTCAKVETAAGHAYWACVDL